MRYLFMLFLAFVSIVSFSTQAIATNLNSEIIENLKSSHPVDVTYDGNAVTIEPLADGDLFAQIIDEDTGQVVFEFEGLVTKNQKLIIDDNLPPRIILVTTTLNGSTKGHRFLVK